MLEIFILLGLYRSFSAAAVKRGRSQAWGLVGVGGWIGGEMSGMVVGLALDLGAGAYGLALLGAVAGAFIAYRIVMGLDDLSSPDLDIEKISDTFR